VTTTCGSHNRRMSKGCVVGTRSGVDIDETKGELWCGWTKDEEGADDDDDDRQATRRTTKEQLVRRQ
jgi:hypothetical protein